MVVSVCLFFFWFGFVLFSHSILRYPFPRILGAACVRSVRSRDGKERGDEYLFLPWWCRCRPFCLGAQQSFHKPRASSSCLLQCCDLRRWLFFPPLFPQPSVVGLVPLRCEHVLIIFYTLFSIIMYFRVFFVLGGVVVIVVFVRLASR